MRTCFYRNCHRRILHGEESIGKYGGTIQRRNKTASRANSGLPAHGEVGDGRSTVIIIISTSSSTA